MSTKAHFTDFSATLLQDYHLNEGDVLQQVSNIHLQEISRSCSLKWRLLPAHLEMKNPATVVHDVERGGKPEDEMRADFLARWQMEKGTGANYKSLINALLVIGCKQDAEYVCGLLNRTKTITRESSGNNGELSGELVQENFSKIRGCFATLVDKVAMKLTSLNVSVDRFRTFVAILFRPGDILSNATTILEIFHALTHTGLWDHSYFSAFESIYKEFGQEDPQLKILIDKYKAELAGFKATTKIIDYIKLCNCLDDFADSEQSISQYKARYDKKYCKRLAIKIGKQITEKSLEYVDEFWRSISDLFLLPSLPVLLASIHEGCTEITWLISTHLASQIESAIVNRNLSVTLLQLLQVTRVSMDGRILYLEKEPPALQVQEKVQILEQQLKERDIEIEHLKEEILVRDLTIVLKNDTIIRLQNELEVNMKELQDLKMTAESEQTSIASEQQDVSPYELQLTWSHGPDILLDDVGTYMQSVVVQDKVYFGGDMNNLVMEFDTNGRRWGTIAPYVASHFAMVEINDQLVLVGGLNENGASKLLGVWRKEEWTYPYPAMPIGRNDCSAVVYSEYLVVAGGKGDSFLDLLCDILNTETKQWFAGPPLPQPCTHMNTTVVDDTCYFVGEAHLFSISIPLDGKMNATFWKEVTAPPNFDSFPLSLNGSLYAVGGFNSDNEITTAIHLYQPDLEEWVKVGDLLSPRYCCACAMITNREMLVVGGYDEDDSVQKRTDIAMIMK